MIDFELLENEVRNCDKVFIDTSALMNEGALLELIDYLEMPLMEQKKKIIVPDDVWMELMKFLSSGTEDKKEKACRAVDLLWQYRNIFNTNTEIGFELRREKPFTDKALLIEFLKNKSYFKQLMISSDKGLIADALDINDLRSYQGREVTAFYLDQTGRHKLYKHSIKADRDPVRQVQAVFNRNQTKDASVPEKKGWAIAGAALGLAAALTSGFWLGRTL